MQPGFVRTCTEVDATTGACVAEAWLPPATFLPTFTIAEAESLGAAIALLWAIAWVARMMGRVVKEN